MAQKKLWHTIFRRIHNPEGGALILQPLDKGPIVLAQLFHIHTLQALEVVAVVLGVVKSSRHVIPRCPNTRAKLLDPVLGGALGLESHLYAPKRQAERGQGNEVELLFLRIVEQEIDAPRQNAIVRAPHGNALAHGVRVVYIQRPNGSARRDEHSPGVIAHGIERFPLFSHDARQAQPVVGRWGRSGSHFAGFYVRMFNRAVT